MENDDGDVEQGRIHIGDDTCVVMDQYLDKKELKKPILEERNVFHNDLLLRTSWIWCLRQFSTKETWKAFWDIFKVYFILPPPTPRIRKCNTRHNLGLCGRVANMTLCMNDLGHTHYPPGMCYSFIHSFNVVVGSTWVMQPLPVDGIHWHTTFIQPRPAQYSTLMRAPWPFASCNFIHDHGWRWMKLM